MLPATGVLVLGALLAVAALADRIADRRLKHKMRTYNITLKDDAMASTNFSLNSLMRDILTINAPTSSHNNSQCRVDSEIYRREALAKSPWALQMYDASTKLPDGLLVGNLIQLGNFDECLAVKWTDETDPGSRFLGQYCLAGVTLAGGNQSVATNSTKNHLVQSLLDKRLLWSICIPSSCHPEDLQAHLQVHMRRLLLEDDNSTDLHVAVYPGNCYTAHGEPLGKEDWAVILLLAAFLIVVVASTVYDTTIAHITAEGKEANAFVAFSVYKNCRSLFNISSRGQMASVHGIKFLSMMWIVLFHKYSVMVETPNVNSDAVLEGLKYDWTQMPLSNGGSLAVNTFFVVSGLLLTYVFFRDRDADRPFNVISFYVYRYIRLTPIYAIVIGMYATVCYHFGNGPLWNTIMGMHRSNCRQHWWRNLLYINNYQPVTSELCVVQSWYLAADTQLYWLSPLLLYPLWKWPKYGRIEMALLFVVPIVIPAWLTYTKNWPWGDVKDMTDEVRNEYFPKLYAATYTRAAPFLVGVLLGYILYSTKKKKLILSKWIVFLGWLVSTAISLTIIYAIHLYYKKDHPYNPLEAAFFGGLHPIAWGAVIAWIIFACETGYAGPVKTILSWPWFQPLSKLSYSAYLVHFMVFYHDLAITRTPSHYDHYSVIHYVLGDLVIIMLLAAVFALTFEMPVLNLDKLFLKPEAKPAPRRTTKAILPRRSQASLPPLKIPNNKKEENQETNGSPAGINNLAFEKDETVTRSEPEDVKVDITKM
ncbi:nose resistant to fluoxetine protein 6 [Anabrus simplex]|uniref:nose resistant to fluoxetine protein 6 n=1 Tax=Anabrus simplex TaxID=316456 RepID=UPI0035A27898